jgi:hypothetical protein
MEYSDKLKSPKWQKKRLQILERDNWQCQYCKDTETQLQVHHLKYTKEPWDANKEDLITTCSDCHALISTCDFKFNSIIKMKLSKSNGYKFICKGQYNDGVDGICFFINCDNQYISIGFSNEQINKIKDLL